MGASASRCRGSYQERDFGYSQVSVPNGWRPFRGDENNWGTIPQPGSPGSENITNRPDATDIYSVPQNLNFSINGVQRKRTNGQVAFQWAPTDAITTTLDYTYSENKIQQQRNELSVWFNFGPSVTSWTDGPVAAPIIYSEIINPATSDLSMGGMQLANVNENKSLGFNVAWEVSDGLDLALDYHDSSAETRPDSPWGSAGVLGVAAFVRGTTTADFSGDFPVLTVALPPGVAAVAPSQALVTGSVFQNAFTRADIKQLQLSGRAEFGEASGLDFGLSRTEVENRTAYGFMQRDTWGGVGTPADYDDSIWFPDNMGNYFDALLRFERPALHRPVPAVRLRTPAQSRRRTHRTSGLVPGAEQVRARPAHPGEIHRRVRAVHDDLRLADAARRRDRRALGKHPKSPHRRWCRSRPASRGARRTNSTWSSPIRPSPRSRANTITCCPTWT